MRLAARFEDAVMLRVARGMSVASIANDLGITIVAVLNVLWEYGDDDTSPSDRQGIDPTPRQIRLRCLAIRSEWKPEAFHARNRLEAYESP